MKLLTGVVCLSFALTAGQLLAQSEVNDFASFEAARRTAEFTPARYGTLQQDDSVRKWKRHWTISAVALVAASALDAGSSWGQREANPMLQGGGGTFSGRSAAIKLGIGVVPLVFQRLAARNNESLYKSFAIANYGAAGFFTGVAVRNFRVR